VRTRGLPQLFALAAVTGGLFGYLMAVSNDAIAFVREDLDLAPFGSALVVSGLVAGALLGCLAAGSVADRLGRRLSLVIAAVLSIVGVLLSSASSALPVMLAGRLVAGVAVGLTSAITPLYLAELAPFSRRGTLLTSYQLFITVGILVAFGVGLLLSPGRGWRWMFAAGLFFGLAQLVVALVVPASPRFLVRRGRLELARESLLRLRSPEEAEAELDAIVVASEVDSTAPRPSLLAPRFRPAVVVGLVMALMNALVGVGAVIYYSSDVFRAAGVSGANGAEIASLAVGGVNTAGAVLAVWLTNRHGRRPLLTVGLAGMVVCLVAAGVTLMSSLPGVGTVTVAAVLAYMVFFAISAGPLAWLLVAEVMPGEIRARAAGHATAANWGANLLVTLLFPVVVGDPGVPSRVGAVFVFFAVLSVGFLIFVRLRVPETKDRTLEDIEADLRPSAREV
jgi:sugar porter (SP) family MFS transporter